MANKRIIDLTEDGSYDGDNYIEVDQAGNPESYKQKVSVIVNEEATDRADQDDVIEAGCGLETDGTYDADDTTNYIRTADFSAAGYTESLKEADHLLDTQIKANADAIAGQQVMTTITVTCASPNAQGLNAVPYTLLSASGLSSDSYVLVDVIAQLDYSGGQIDVSNNPLVLRYSGGTEIGEWTYQFYQGSANAMQKIKFNDNVDVALGEAIELYCAANDGGVGSTSDIVVTFVYVLVEWA